MAEYLISLKDEASGIAGSIRRNIAALRSELRSVGEVRVSDGNKLSTWLKATAAQTAARAASEMAAAALIRRTTAANAAAAASADARVAAERRVAGALAKTLHYEMRLRSVRGPGAGAGGGGGATNIPAAPGGLGGGGDAFGRALPWAVGGAAAAVGGVAAFFGIKAGIAGLQMAASASLSVLDSLASVIGRVATAAGTLTVEFGKATISAFDFHTRATMAFKAMTGNGERGFGRMKELAVELGTSLETTMTGIRAFTAAGFKGQEAERWFKRTQDLAGIGLDQSQIGRATLAIGQIKGAGTLQGDEMRQLGELGISMESIWTEIAKKMGKSVAEAKKLKEAGKVDSATALFGIEKAISKMTGGGAAGALGREMGRKTVAGFVERLSLLKSLFFDKVSEDSGIGGMLEKVNTAADGLLKWMNESDEAASMFKEIGGIVTGITGDLGSLATNEGMRTLMGQVKDVTVAAFRLGDGIWSAAKAFGGGLLGNGTFGGLKNVASVMTDIGKRLKSEEAQTFFRALGEWTGKAADSLLNYVSVLTQLSTGGDVRKALEGSGLSGAAQSLGESLGMGIALGVANWAASGILRVILGEAVYTLGSDMLVGGMTAAQQLVTGFVNGLLEGVPLIKSVAESLGIGTIVGVQEGTDSHSPSRKAAKIGGWVTEGLAGGMVANDNARTAGRTVAADVQASMMGGFGLSPTGAAAPMAAAAGAVTNSRGPVTVNISILGNADRATVDDLESRLAALLERMVA